MNYVGLDLGLRQSSLCLLDAHGKILQRQEIKGDWNQVAQTVRQLPGPLAVCFEASCGYGRVYDLLQPHAARLSVAHPGQLRLIYHAKKKNNRLDAEKLAKLLYLDLVPQVHVPALDVRAWRALIEFRQTIVHRRVAVKNQLRALLRGLGIAAPRGLWTVKGQHWLQTLELGGMDGLRRDMLLQELEQIHQRLQSVEAELEQIAKTHPGVALLRTIPGVGLRTAEAFVAYIDDPRRFARVRQVGSYLGLVPCQDATGDLNRLGHITRDGPATVRKLLCEAAWQSIRRDPALKAYFERVMRGDPERKKIALVATAHHLARVMLAMLRTGEVYRSAKVPG